MKVLDINQFVSERMKINPITRGELETARDLAKQKRKIYAAAIRDDDLKKIIPKENPEIEEFRFGYHLTYLMPEDAVDWFIRRMNYYITHENKDNIWWLGYFNEEHTMEEAKKKLETLKWKSCANDITKVAGTADIN